MTINYKGMELEEITEPQIFNPPKEMLVWDEGFNSPIKRVVCTTAVDSRGGLFFIARISEQLEGVVPYHHCAEIPEEPKPRRATWQEVARWCATGRGLVYDRVRDKADTGVMFKPECESETITSEFKVRKWSDTEWHEPTMDYLFGGDK